MLENSTSKKRMARGVKRAFGALMATALAAGGMQFVSASPAAAVEASYNPISDYTGYNVVAFNDLHVTAESEGPVAVGGKFSFDGSQTIVKLPDTPAGLVVKGGIDWVESTGTHQVNLDQDPKGPALSLNLSGSEALDKDANGASVQVRVVPEGNGYGAEPSIQLNNNDVRAADVAYRADLFDPLFDQGKAVGIANTLADQSKAECQAPYILKKVADENAAADGPAYWIMDGKPFVKLKEGVQNIWNLEGSELNDYQEITFRSGPSPTTPLFINVSGSHIDFKANLAGVSPGPNAKGMLWNFFEATSLTLSGDSINGSVLAPNAHFDKKNSNVDGNIIVKSGRLAGSEQHHYPFAGKFNPCGDTPTPGASSIATTVAVEGSDAKLLPLTGGTVVDTVSYNGLTVGQKYLLEGELHTQDATATGIKATKEFTAESVDGSVDVTFTITAEQVQEYAGKKLVAFEQLFELDADGVKSENPVATHEDPKDEAQTFTVEDAPVAKVGGFSLKKELSGVGESAFDTDAAFTVEATWTDADNTEVTKSFELPVNGSQVAGPQNLPVGTTVTFKETLKPAVGEGYEFVDVEFAPKSLTISEDDNVVVTATNTYKPIEQPEPGKGKITVTKVVDGSGANTVGDKEFNFTLRCEVADPAPVIDDEVVAGLNETDIDTDSDIAVAAELIAL